MTGMVLTLTTRFAPDTTIHGRIVAHLAGRLMHDGGRNCEDHDGATHILRSRPLAS